MMTGISTYLTSTVLGKSTIASQNGSALASGEPEPSIGNAVEVELSAQARDFLSGIQVAREVANRLQDKLDQLRGGSDGNETPSGNDGRDDEKLSPFFGDFFSGTPIIFGSNVSVEGTDADELFAVGSNSVVEAGKGNDQIWAWSDARVDGGDGDDLLRVWSNSIVNGGSGSDYIDAWSESRVDGGEGDDFIKAWSNSLVSGGNGNDVIDAWSDSRVDGGAGDDLIKAWSNSEVFGGSGNDVIDAWSDSRVDGGSGDDTIYAHTDSVVHGGDGADYISVMGGGSAHGGDGNDEVHVYGDGAASGGSGSDFVTVFGDGSAHGGSGNDSVTLHGTGIATGGAGNDQIYALDRSYLDGGEGNDSLSAGHGSTVVGGKGNDNILVRGQATVIFNAGDGQDTVAMSSGTVMFGAELTADKAQISVNGNTVSIAFEGRDEQLSLVIGDSEDDTILMFADGSTKTLTRQDQAAEPGPALSIDESGGSTKAPEVVSGLETQVGASPEQTVSVSEPAIEAEPVDVVV